MMDLYNKYVGNADIDLRNAGRMGRSTHIYKAWEDSIGNVHLDVQIDCTDENGTKSKWVIPDLCIPMDGVIHFRTTKDPEYFMGVLTRAWFEPCQDIILQQGYSDSHLASSEKTPLPYYVATEPLDPPVKEMTLEEVERELGYKVQIVSEKSIKKE